MNSNSAIEGLSDPTLSSYIHATALSSTSASNLQTALHDQLQLPKTSALSAFAIELFNKLPVKAIRKEKKEIKVGGTKKFKMLEDEEDIDVFRKEREKKKSKERDKEKGDRKSKIVKGSLKTAKRSGEGSKAREAAWDLLDADEDFESEKESDGLEETAREKDLRERDEFANRLLSKDIQREPKAVKKEVKVKRDMESIRLESRSKYLKKREDSKLDELEQEIKEEEEMFDIKSMTKKEQQTLTRKKALLRIAKERIVDKPTQKYHMPAEKGFEPIKEAEAYQTEGDSWMQNQSKFDKLIPTPLNEGFDYVFDEAQQVSFVLQKTKEVKVKVEKAVSQKEHHKMNMKEVRESLPIFVYRDQLLEAIEQFQVLIIVGETGSGKTTQIPQYLMEAGYCSNGRKVGCTQPRRVAAMSVAARVADERGSKLGSEIGYSIRFEDCTSQDTKVKYMTDGMLLREFLTEPDLQSYSCLIIDEAHERSLHTDILFGLVKDIARFRPDLKLLISSATMDANKFSEYFDDAPIFNIPGRKFAVDVYHTAAPEGNYLAAAITTIMTIHITQDAGDILVFLTGQDEIEQIQESLSSITKSLGSKIKELIVCPIYANLPSEMQAKIFEKTPEGSRKVVLSTNIAETSITIEGVVYVVDTGFSKQTNFNPANGLQSLVVVPTSRASANQRKGRAGRVSKGKCFRLYTQWAFQNELDENTIPEIQRTNMANTVLLLKSLGINDLMGFDFMDAPPADTLIRALELLYALGALNDRGELTKLGRKMAEFPIDPMLSKTLVASEMYNCSEQVVSIIAMLTAGNTVFYRPKDKLLLADQARKSFFRKEGDFMTLLMVYDRFTETGGSMQWCFENFIQYRVMMRVQAVRDQLVGLMERTEVQLLSTVDDTVGIRKAFTAGFFYNAAKLGQEDNYRTVKGGLVTSIHPSSTLFKEGREWVLYFEFMRQCIEIEAGWLREVAAHYYTDEEVGKKEKRVNKKNQ